ncbi:MAG TPA: protease SohB, partial [Planctomycetes bacterium]|nr:protease SohB [Planctomycetota bacterium]
MMQIRIEQILELMRSGRELEATEIEAMLFDQGVEVQSPSSKSRGDSRGKNDQRGGVRASGKWPTARTEAQQRYLDLLRTKDLVFSSGPAGTGKTYLAVAAAVRALREEVTAILMVANKDDEVILRLESPGGVVHGYGLAASQLRRLKDKDLRLTVAVDKVAASGGYMMACVAEKIIAAPFAVLGSIGVVAQFPNFNRLLKEKNIDLEHFTAG